MDESCRSSYVRPTFGYHVFVPALGQSIRLSPRSHEMMTRPIYLLRQNDSFYWSYRSHGRMTRSICLVRQNDLEIKKKKIAL